MPEPELLGRTAGHISIVSAAFAVYSGFSMSKGGQAGKFGNDYEASWTVSNLLLVADGTATEMCAEPLDDGLGIEFTITQATGVREHHSAKIQTTANYWTMGSLLKIPPERSIIGDLFDKMAKFPTDETVFVSEVGANPLQQICEAARLAGNDVDFKKQLNASLTADFQTSILPLFKDVAEARDRLRRLHAVAFYQSTVDRNIERDINRLLERTDNQPLDAADVRRLMKEIILENLGKTVTKADILTRLKKEGYELSDYTKNETVLETVRKRNDGYTRTATKFLINKTLIRRKEAQEAFLRLESGEVKFGAFVGAAGMGKSCAIAELFLFLEDGKVPCLALRLDTPFKSIIAKNLGVEMGFAMSPVHVLGKVSGGGPCVLILDQLDALSIVSGRARQLWDVVDELLEEVSTYPKMRVWIGCRTFDLENDPTIRAMIKKHGMQRFELKPLTFEEVKQQVKVAGFNPDVLTEKQLEVLQTPMHLSIYIDGVPDPTNPFRNVIDLYDRYWERKQEQIFAETSRHVQWTEVIGVLCDDLTERQSLGAPVSIFDGSLMHDAKAMASANVLSIDGKTCRFFHEGFFDYAFARQFVRKGKKLADFLLHSGEQDIFRRSQVRQVLAYLRNRGDDQTVYLAELESLLKTEGIRPHILQLVFNWLSDLPNPSQEELALLALEK